MRKILLQNIQCRGEDGEDFIKRKDTYEIPPAALREALINAVVHRDYAVMNSDIKIAVFDNKVEITSPGMFPRGITVEEAISGRSEIRNRVLARIFNEAHFTEQWGRGINRIFTLCEEAGLEHPEIVESGMFVQVRIFRKKQDEKTGRKNRTKKQDEKTGRKNRTKKQDENYQQILNHFSKEETFTARQFSEMVKLSKSRSAVILSELVKQGLIIKEGQSRKTCYKRTKY